MDGKNILKSEAPTLVLKAEPDGKILVRSQSIDSERAVVRMGEVLELAWVEGKIVATILPERTYVPEAANV